MKILHIVPTYLPAHRYGGPIESVHALNKWLVKLGAEVTVYTTNADGPDDLSVPINVPVDVDGVKVFYFPVGFLRKWFYSGNMRRALKAHVKDFDLVHITSVFLSVSTLGAWYARRAHKPYLISPRGSLMRAPLQKKSSLKKSIYISLLEKWNLKNAAGIHFTAHVEESEYKDTGLPLKRSVLIPNSLDPESLPEGDGARFRLEFGVASGEKLVLFLGRLNWKKGLDLLIEAYAGLLKEVPEAILMIAGGDDEGYKRTVEELAAKEGVLEKIIFTGELTGPRRTGAFKAADIFVLPSYSENFGMAVAEAMYLGLPVVITKEVGIAPWVDEGEAGFVTNPKAQEIRMALFKALQDPKRLKQMGENGKAVVERYFSPKAVAEAFLSAYNGLIHEKSTRYRDRSYL